MTKLERLMAVAVLAVAMTGCAVPKFLIQDSFIGSMVLPTTGTTRNDKTVLIPAVRTDNKEILYDYIVRLCDLDANGAESNCRDSVVLANVVSNSLY